MKTLLVAVPALVLSGVGMAQSGAIVEGELTPVGAPGGAPVRAEAGPACVVDLTQRYTVDGGLSGRMEISYRILVHGPCGSPAGAFDEEWIAHGMFDGTLDGDSASGTFVYTAEVRDEGQVSGNMAFGSGLRGELTIRGRFSEGSLAYSGSVELESGVGGPESSRPATAEPRVSNQGVFIDHKSCGGGDTTLLFVHGWAIDQTYWSDQVEAFCPEYHVVTIDLPGHGRSGKNRDRWAVEDYAGDVRATIDQLHLGNVILVGHSMAGNIILEAALDNDKVLALVGVDNFKTVDVAYSDEMKARIADFIQQLRTDFDATAVAFARRNLFQATTDSAVIERVLRSVEGVDSVVSAATLAGVYAYAPGAAGRLSQLKQPLYLINSSATATDVAGLKATGVAVQVLDVGPTSHYPMIEDPQAFDSRLREVLRDIAARARE